ncbi:MAG: TIGR04372 family glycosyltransferase [Deltaproteobacteria bacterium]|nr:TIGR04372 family glycosyltransferase [Deltaproteobacteria bacterium]
MPQAVKKYFDENLTAGLQNFLTASNTSDAVGKVMNIGQALREAGLMQESLMCFGKAIELQPKEPHVWRMLAGTLYFMGQWKLNLRAQKMFYDLEHAESASERKQTELRYLPWESYTVAIGHMTYLDAIAKRKMLGWQPPYKLVLLAPPNRVANRCYLEYWRPYLDGIITDPAEIESISPLDEKLRERHNFMSLSNGQSLYYKSAIAKIEEKWEADGRAPLLTLSESDCDRGFETLKKMGVPPDAWFVGLHVREDNHSWRVARNADINNYQLAMRSVAERGGWVIRMGDRYMKPLPPMKNVIDYVHSDYKSDWMDVFLWAKARFYLGTNSGPVVVPTTFGVPCINTNLVPLGNRGSSSRDTFVPKLVWSQNKSRYLTFSEMLDSPSGWSEVPQYLTQNGYILHENTAEDINEAVLEMFEKTENSFKLAEEDQHLQEKFKKLEKTHQMLGRNKIGRMFLRKYASLL